MLYKKPERVSMCGVQLIERLFNIARNRLFKTKNKTSTTKIKVKTKQFFVDEMNTIAANTLQ